MAISAIYAGLLLVVSGALSHLLTRLVINRASTLGLVQDPVARSSHEIPTPSGGGISFAAVTTGIGILVAYQLPWMLGIVAVAAATAILGLIDDLLDLRASIRFPVQVTLVLAILVLAGPYPALPLPFGFMVTGAALGVLLLIAGLWWLNLFNFMDGIDGLAASQALLITSVALVIWVFQDPNALEVPLFWIGVTTAGTVSGFLVSNWPPARVFMGDAGSNFLAAILFAMLLSLISAGTIGYGTAVILVAPLASDATVTLLRRIANGEKPWTAHRRHAYQRLARRYGHGPVTIGYGAIYLLWATPLAVLSVRHPEWQTGMAFAATAPLLLLAIILGAGSRDE